MQVQVQVQTKSMRPQVAVSRCPMMMLMPRLWALLVVLVMMLTTSGTCFAQSGVTKTVSGLTAVQTCTPTDLAMIVDVSDLTMAATGTNKKIQIQYMPQGFPAGSISGATLSNDILGPGSISGASLVPTVLGVKSISGVSLASDILGVKSISGTSLSESILAAQAITGATLTANPRYYSIPFQFDKQTLGVTPFAGASVFMVNQAAGILKGVDLICYPTAPVNSGVTFQLYKANKSVPTITYGNSVLSGSGVSVMSTGTTCFWTWTSAVTTFADGDVLVGYISGVGTGSTVAQATAVLKVMKDGS